MALKFMLTISCCRLDSFACDLSTPHSFVGALMLIQVRRTVVSRIVQNPENNGEDRCYYIQ
jgi:hypothetical protein